MRKEFEEEKERKIGRKNRKMEKYMRRKERRNRGVISVAENRRKKSTFTRKAYVLKLYKDSKYRTYSNSEYPFFRRGLATLMNAASSRNRIDTQFIGINYVRNDSVIVS